MTGVRFSQVNNNQLQWSLVSKTARFEEGETRIYFHNPKMDLFKDNKLATKLESETGFLNMIKKDAQLEKNVRV